MSVTPAQAPPALGSDLKVPATPLSDEDFDTATLVEERSSEDQLLEALHANLKTSKIQDDLEVATENAINSVGTLKERFTVVESRLTEIDRKKLNDALAPDWRDLHERFIRLVTESQNLAQSVADAAHRFNDFILQPTLDIVYLPKITKEDLEGILDEIEPFLQEGKQHEKKADEQKEAFYRLKADIQVFSTRLNEFGSQKSESLDKELGAIKAQMEIMADKLKDLGEVVKSRRNLDANVSGLARTILPILRSAELIQPQWVCAAEIAGFVLVQTTGYFARKAQRDLTEQEREFLKAGRKEQKLTKDKEAIPSLQAEVKKLADTEVKMIIENIVVFEEVWGVIARACQSIHEALERIQTKSSTEKPRLPRSVSHDCAKAAVVSVFVVRSLELYATGMKDKLRKLQEPTETKPQSLSSI